MAPRPGALPLDPTGGKAPRLPYKLALPRSSRMAPSKANSRICHVLDPPNFETVVAPLYGVEMCTVFFLHFIEAEIAENRIIAFGYMVELGLCVNGFFKFSKLGELSNYNGPTQSFKDGERATEPIKTFICFTKYIFTDLLRMLFISPWNNSSGELFTTLQESNVRGKPLTTLNALLCVRGRNPVHLYKPSPTIIY